MSQRKTPLATGEYYHIFNRGVACLPTFLTKADYWQAITSFSYYKNVKPFMKFSRFKDLSFDEKDSVLERSENTDKLVDLICYCLMPNHFHFIIKQLVENGISIFLSKFTNSYTKYFNTKNERVGSLFQGVFKSVHIDSTNQLVHLSRYIHLNPLTSFVVPEKNFVSYPWSSLNDYLENKNTLVNPSPVLSEFSSSKKYLDFVLNQKDYQRSLKQIEYLLTES
jgi:putative transposase